MIKRFLLRLQWAGERKQEVKRVGTNLASHIIARRNKLYDEYLLAEKQRKDVKEYKIRLEELDWIIRGCK